jgi:hypothetical protein
MEIELSSLFSANAAHDKALYFHATWRAEGAWGVILPFGNTRKAPLWSNARQATNENLS